MSDKQCLFCAIIGKAAHAFIVYENSHTVVFLDRRPINVGHLLIVPTQHVEAFYALDENAFIAFMLVVKRMAAIIEALYQPKKVGMLAAGFDVAHAHLHVLPLYDAHDLTSKVLLEGKGATPTEEDLRLTAERIERGLQAQGNGASQPGPPRERPCAARRVMRGVRQTNTQNLEGTMTREEKIAVVESYIHGLGKGDFSHVPFADDVSYESPLTPKRIGQEAIAFLSALFPIMQGAEVQQHIVEGEYIATVFRLRTPNGITTVFDKFRVVDGKLKEINPYYDPSVLNEAVKLL